MYEIWTREFGVQLATRNLVPGVSAYGERLIQKASSEFRLWDPYRSKLAAAIKKGLHELPIKSGKKVLYLGAAAGTTVSHVSDIVENSGVVYAVEFSSRSIRELLVACKGRNNVVPILSDARNPEGYRSTVGAVDVIYADVAQPDQAKIVVDNFRTYCSRNASAMLVVKSRSVDVSESPAKIFAGQRAILERDGFRIVEEIELSPYERDHELIVGNGN